MCIGPRGGLNLANVDFFRSALILIYRTGDTFMKRLLTAGLAIALFAPQAFAEGDADKGKKNFNK